MDLAGFQFSHLTIRAAIIHMGACVNIIGLSRAQHGGGPIFHIVGPVYTVEM